MATKKTAKKTATKASTATSAKQTATKTGAKAEQTSKSTVDTVVENLTEAVEDVTERTDEFVETAVRFARDAAHASIGAGLVVQDRVSQRKFELIDYRTFNDEAKAKGEERVNEVQDFFEPITKRVNETVEPITERIEAQLPTPVREAIVERRERMRELLAV